MGMFDTVWIPCPKCDKFYEAQTKSGPCVLADYYLPEEGGLNPAPEEVLQDINRHAPFYCECGCKFKISTVREYVTKYVVKETNDDD